MSMRLPDDVFNRINLERYGLGVPAFLAILGAAVMYRSFVGINTFYGLSIYGQFGVVVLVGLALALFWLSGYTYTYVDTTRWLLTEEEDKEPLIEDG